MPREAESSYSFLQVTQAAPVFKVVTTPSTISSFLSFFKPRLVCRFSTSWPFIPLVCVCVGWLGGGMLTQSGSTALLTSSSMRGIVGSVLRMLNQNWRHWSDLAAVQCILQKAAYQQSDVPSCGPLVDFCLYGPFNHISFHKFSQQLPTFSFCSSSLNSALLVLSTIYLFMKVLLAQI